MGELNVEPTAKIMDEIANQFEEAAGDIRRLAAEMRNEGSFEQRPRTRTNHPRSAHNAMQAYQGPVHGSYPAPPWPWP